MKKNCSPQPFPGSGTVPQAVPPTWAVTGTQETGIGTPGAAAGPPGTAAGPHGGKDMMLAIGLAFGAVSRRGDSRDTTTRGGQAKTHAPGQHLGGRDKKDLRGTLSSQEETVEVEEPVEEREEVPLDVAMASTHSKASSPAGPHAPRPKAMPTSSVAARGSSAAAAGPPGAQEVPPGLPQAHTPAPPGLPGAQMSPPDPRVAQVASPGDASGGEPDSTPVPPQEDTGGRGAEAAGPPEPPEVPFPTWEVQRTELSPTSEAELPCLDSAPLAAGLAAAAGPQSECAPETPWPTR